MPDHEFDTSTLLYQRLTLGILGVAMLAIGGVMYVSSPVANVFISAILIRVGMLLCVIWLAFDQLVQLSKYFSTIVLVVGLGLLVLLAAKPDFSRIVIVVCAALGALSLAAKFLRANR